MTADRTREIRAFYSDPHFGHKNIIEYDGRPFDDVEDMEFQLVSRYNDAISTTDTVLWVGDAFFLPVESAKRVLSRMKGTKWLVLGNHDKSAASMLEIGFSLVTRELRLSIAGRVCLVNHFPYAGTTKDDRYPERRPVRVNGEILIHGHTHQKTRRSDNMIHVGVPAWDYGPAMIEDVEALVRE